MSMTKLQSDTPVREATSNVAAIRSDADRSAGYNPERDLEKQIPFFYAVFLPVDSSRFTIVNILNFHLPVSIFNYNIIL